MPVLCLPHGGGPLPLLGEPGHQALTAWLAALANDLPQLRAIRHLRAIVMISAHWEGPLVQISGHPQPPMLYDYSGFPPESYTIQHPAPGDPELAETIHHLLADQGIASAIDRTRGFDHGAFVPMRLLDPAATIPMVQVGLLHHLDPQAHIALGQALAPLREQDVLIIGSGMSTHNLPALLGRMTLPNGAETAFTDWLVATLTASDLAPEARAEALHAWSEAPGATACHPREEHLLPFHVCAGAAQLQPGRVVFDQPVMGHRTVGVQWD